MLLNICTNESPEDNQCDRVVVDSFEKGGAGVVFTYILIGYIYNIQAYASLAFTKA